MNDTRNIPIVCGPHKCVIVFICIWIFSINMEIISEIFVAYSDHCLLAQHFQVAFELSLSASSVSW